MHATNTNFSSEPTSQWTIPLDRWKTYFHAKNPRFSHTLYSTLSDKTKQERALVISKIHAITGSGHDYQLCVPVETRHTKPLPDDPHNCSNTVLEAIGRILAAAVADASTVDAPDVDAMDIDEDESSHQQHQHHQQHNCENCFHGTTSTFSDDQIAQKLEQKQFAERQLVEAESQRDEHRFLLCLAMRDEISRQLAALQMGRGF